MAATVSLFGCSSLTSKRKRKQREKDEYFDYKEKYESKIACIALETQQLEDGLRTMDEQIEHPYSSWERGTNEVTNKLVRRKIPKGENFDSKTDEEIQSIENWINNYPRWIHEYRTAGELFTEEVRKIG